MDAGDEGSRDRAPQARAGAAASERIRANNTARQNATGAAPGGRRVRTEGKRAFQVARRCSRLVRPDGEALSSVRTYTSARLRSNSAA